ncbi:MAG: hypothetical protein VR65_00595 [Desulfobulbaceae bacterium BRH_c16a]|nr:MAG: hypothetical protein VR65_00595 [Desulfobulbaceae bacterium BRH_c16a]
MIDAGLPPRQNLATFCTTWLGSVQTVDECIGKNMIDKDEYPKTAEMTKTVIIEPHTGSPSELS